jgi:ATP-binding cassette, subfamily B, bacterial
MVSQAAQPILVAGGASVQTFLQVLTLARGRGRSFLVVALMVSFGTAATLCEPWIYRAIIDDIAGVFVPPRAVVEVEGAFENAARSVEHWSGALGRIFTVPMAPFESTDATRRTLDPKHPREAAATVLLGAMLLVVIRLGAEGFKRLADNRATVLANELEQDFIIRTFKHVIRLPLEFFSRRASGTVARQIDQSDNVAPIFTAVAKELWPDLFRLLAILAIMLTVNYELAMVATLTVGLYGVVSWRLTRTIENDAERYYGLWDEVTSRVQQAVAGIKTVRAHGTESYETTRLQEAIRDAYSTHLHRTRTKNRYSYWQDSVISISKACVLAVGGLKAIEHQLTPGDVVMFLAYLDRLYAPIEGLTGLYTTLQQHVVGVRRAHRLLEEPAGADDTLPSLRIREGDIRFENVRFAYNDDHPVLEGVSFELKGGQRTALIGPSGAGKTTVTDLLVALYRPQAGEIFIDDQKLSGLSLPSVRSTVRSVAADGAIFRMSIGDNIRYGHPDASDDVVCEAIVLAGLTPVIDRLPDGLDTIVGEQGVELSLGERQRVLLARAFVARPSILILDEATANLDFRTEASVKQALEVISKGQTTLIVAHRRSMLTSVDRVLVLRGGRIEQDGTPADLMNRSGYFRDMMSAGDGSTG